MTGAGADASTTFRYGGASGRRSVILRRLRRSAYVSYAELGTELGVSERTIRRDLADLGATGAVQLVPGGATMAPGQPRGALPAVGNPPQARLGRLLAATAARLVGPGTTVALDNGPGAAQLVDALPVQRGLTVVTAALDVMARAAERDDLALIGVGGSFDGALRGFTGPAAREGMGALRAGVGIVSAEAVGDGALWGRSQPGAEMTRAVLDSSALRVLVCPSSAFAADAPVRVADLAVIDVVVTDDELTEGHRSWLRAAEVELLTV
ncbi:MAG TPA: DeoR/GlpR family DNA-binding transcription regulator [Actinotalea sp.]